MSGPRSASAEFAAGEESSDRRREILVACVRVLAERGFAKTRMSDIAAEVGVTAPLLLHYFGSKNELIIEALMAAEEPYLLNLREEFEAGDPPEQLLVRYVEDSVSPPKGSKGWWREASAVWINGWVTALHDPIIARAREAEDRRWRELLAQIVERGQEEGTFSSQVDAKAFVWTLFALLEGFLVQLVLEDPEVSESFAHEQSMRFIADQLRFDPFEFSSSARLGV